MVFAFVLSSKINNSIFLYEVDNYFLNGKKYIYKNKIYINTNNIDNILEHINAVIYGDDVLKIVNS